MDKIAMLPPEVLKARLDFINRELQESDRYRISTHRGRIVIKEYYLDNGSKKTHEHGITTVKGKLLLSELEKRSELLAHKLSIESYIADLTLSGEIDTTKVVTCLNKDFWVSHQGETLESDNNSSYVHNGIRMRSRGKVVIAQVLDSLGLQYKYEIKLGIDGDWYYPDFTVFLPEFDRCFLIEFLGMVDDKNYAVKNGMKIGLYMNAGLIINEDILLLSGTRNSMPDAESITEDIVALIKKYCRMYVR